jgi:HK97 family phage portal protein
MEQRWMFFDKFRRKNRASKVPTQSNPFLGLLTDTVKSKTGLDVSEEDTLSSTAVWSAVTQLSQSIASLPLHLYKRLKPTGKERYVQSPLYNLLHLQPNPEMTSMAFREAQAGQVIMQGTAFAEIERDRLDRIVGLWPLLTSRMETIRSKETGNLVYKYNLPDGSYKIFARDMILRISGFSHSGLLGYRTIDKNKEAIAVSLALQEYIARFFGEGAKPPVALEHPGSLSQEAQDRLRRAWNAMHQGLSNSQRVAILEEGMQLKVFGVSPDDAEALDTRKFQIDEVARIFNMPPHMLKSLEHATFSNIEMQSLEFVIYTLRPWLVRFEQGYNIQLLKPKAQNKYFFEHVVEGLLRGDISTRFNAYAVAIQNGWMNADEVREKENLNPQPNKQGQKYHIPLNWIAKNEKKPEPIVQKPPMQGEEETEKEDEEEIKTFWQKAKETRSVVERDRIIKQYQPLFKQAAQRIVNKEAIAVKKEVKQHMGGRAKRDLKNWLEGFYDKHGQYIIEQIGPIFRSFSEAIQNAVEKELGVEANVDELNQFVTEYIETYAKRHTSSSLGQLLALLEKELEDLPIRVDEWREKRADKIAVNETNRKSNAVFGFIAFGAGLSLVWHIRGPETCSYCRALQGKKIKQGQSFFNGGEDHKPKGTETPMFIRGTVRHPPLHRGCDCYASAS